MQTLETERLILRTVSLDDLNDFFEYCKNPKVGRMAGWEPPTTKESFEPVIQKFIDNDNTWAIVCKDNNIVIGAVHLTPDQNRGNYYAKYISYSLSEEYWGKGYMTEAVKRVIKYAFEEMNIDLLTAFHFPDNTRSKGVILKCGFQYEVTISQGSKIYNGEVFDSVCYSILKSDYNSK